MCGEIVRGNIEITTLFSAIRNGDLSGGVRSEISTFGAFLTQCPKSIFSSYLFLKPIDADPQSVPLHTRLECKMVCLVSITCWARFD